ncbi:MAG: hypothetical protein ACKVPX_06220 [Myxococcaceae bacterium]
MTPGPRKIDVKLDSPADLMRIFAAEAMGLIVAQANENMRAQGGSTHMPAAVKFDPDGSVVCEIYQRSQLVRQVAYHPETQQLTIRGPGGDVVSSTKISGLPALPAEVAKQLGVTLPLPKK